MTDPSDLETVEPELDKAVRIYRDFMEEIKARFTVIANIVEATRANPNRERGYLEAELAFLQFRFICELVALASLAAHQPYGMADKLMESWNARLAFRELSRLNSECFPHPIKVNRTDDGVQMEILEGALTRRGFIRYYMKCGRFLHRGVTKHAFEGTARVYDLDALDRWCRRLGQLLSSHTLMILERGTVLIVQLHGGENDSVTIAVGRGDGPARYVKSEPPKRRRRPDKKPPRPE
jgi:hypothetical protein